ncbi:DNA-directed RNA polymerase subunit [Elysia marginata]|uniref:DNA-directed RNA polymerase subunit n=1 Tax=Elysia marginata TaxID=1093978 RepID=A0AAV4HN20_9GAST|nr:DNA-directed RNA polymerase subunit [Elysia marginata]
MFPLLDMLLEVDFSYPFISFTEADSSWKHPTDLPGYIPPGSTGNSITCDSNKDNRSKQDTELEPSSGPFGFDPGSGTDRFGQNSGPDPISSRHDSAPNIPGPSYDQNSPGYGPSPSPTYGFTGGYGPGPGPDTAGYGPNPGFPGYGFNTGPGQNVNSYPGPSDYGMPTPGYGPPNPGYGLPNPAYGQPNPASGYGPSTPGYGPPNPGYGPPAPGYGPPNPGYYPPGPGYNSGYPQPGPGYGPPNAGYGPPAPGIGFGPAYDPNYPGLTAASYYPALARTKRPVMRTESEVQGD